MAREFAKSFYNSNRWKKCRQSYIAQRIAIDGGMCEICHEEPGYIVHHKEWLSKSNIGNQDVTLSFDNLQYVCLDCHNKIDETGEKRTCKFGEDGQIIPIPPIKKA